MPSDCVELVRDLLASHEAFAGRALLARRPGESDESLAARLYDAPFLVLAHGTEPDPVFSYANAAAQRLFERGWDELVGLPSRLSAEAPERSERERLLAHVAAHGCMDDYSGIRIAKSGRRFRIKRATVWNVHDGSGRCIGQAAAFAEWETLD